MRIRLSVKQLSQQQFKQLCQQGTPLAVGRKGPRLLNLPNDHIVKIFWPRKRLTSDQCYPYAKRFVRNAARLKKTGISSLIVTGIERVQQSRIYVVTYHKILGKDVRAIIEHDGVEVLANIAAFVAKLHNNGIFFRGIHLGNLLKNEQQGFSLIDIVNIKFYKRSVPFLSRFRNLKHLFTNSDDKDYFQQFGIDKFLQVYYQHTQLPTWQKKIMSKIV